MTLLLVLLALLLLVLLLAAGAFRLAFYNGPRLRLDPYRIPSGSQYQQNKEKTLSLIREFDALPYEEVFIRSYDGLQLFGRYYHVRDGAPLQIQFHGYRGTALRDFCGGNKLAREAGLNTLVVDQRAHGRSQGRVITMGVKERQDCLFWARYAAERFPETPITLAGVSMGAATVLMAAELELPENVKGILADCPYTEPEAIVRQVLRSRKLPAGLLCGLLSLGTRLFGGYRLTDASALEAVRHARVPILLIHGEDDLFVPCDMSRQLAQAALAAGREIRLETFPGAGHGLSYMVDEPRYRAAVEAFLRDLF